jgi:homoserine O-acetyltransferase/O-succinyltransferase
MNEKIFKYNKRFRLESGNYLPELKIRYTTYGKLNKEKNNVIWIFHALTGNSNPLQWWGGIVGKNKILSPDKYFIVCSNNLGSCYGSTGPASINNETGKKYGMDFPLITIRDMVKAQDILRGHLGIKNIYLSIGGSLGGQICLEWAIMKPALFKHIVPIATNAKHSAWGIAFNETQRMAIEKNKNGIEVARAIAMLSYRCYDIYNKTQTDTKIKLDNFLASSYQRYQGLKLKKRFDKYSYYILSKAMDSHNVGRKRGGVENALKKIKAKTLIIGIKSDLLFPVNEQKLISNYIKYSEYAEIKSIYGHDGFLVENKQITNAIRYFLNNNSNKNKIKKNV